MLVERGIFKEIEVNFLPVGHTHEDIDTKLAITRPPNQADDEFVRRMKTQ
jgi:hypothetical protein